MPLSVGIAQVISRWTFGKSLLPAMQANRWSKSLRYADKAFRTFTDGSKVNKLEKASVFCAELGIRQSYLPSNHCSIFQGVEFQRRNTHLCGQSNGHKDRKLMQHKVGCGQNMYIKRRYKYRVKIEELTFTGCQVTRELKSIKQLTRWLRRVSFQKST